MYIGTTAHTQIMKAPRLIDSTTDLRCIICLYILVAATAGDQTDSVTCRDTRESCRKKYCGQPGIDEHCRRTCGRCTLTDGSPDCAVGMYRKGNSCTACQSQTQDDHDECTRTCPVTGRWGEACDRQCGDSCKSLSCYQWSGECVHGCTEGRHGRLCDLNCEHCGLCGDGVSNCARGDGSCICGCREHFYGVICDIQCDNNCLHTSCNSTTGACTHGCNQGMFGKICNTSCSDKCLHGTCYQNGSCIACVKGHYGKQCREKCSRNCGSEICSRDGSCSPCKPGYFKTQCQEKCSDNCLNRTCSQNNGTCHYGCVSDWHGDTCAVKCPANCATDKCSRDNGSCADGCIDGSYGQHCNLTCSSNCTDMKCTTNEQGGSKPACTLGCKDGVWGDYCDSECPDHCTTCNRRTGTCLKCEHHLYSCNKSCSSNRTRLCTPGCQVSYVQSLHRVIVVLSACLGVLLLVIAGIIARKRVCTWCPVFQRGIYLSPSSPDSRPDEISLQEVNGSRDSEGSRYAVIPDMNNDSSVEERGYEQLNLPPPDTGYTPFLHTCQ